MSPAVVSLQSLPWPAYAALAASGALLVLVGYLRRHRGRPGAVLLQATLLVQAAWCLVYAVALFVSDPGWRHTLEAASWLPMLWVGYPFLGFALDYTGRSDVRRSWSYGALAVVPLVGSLLVLTLPAHDLLWTDARVVRTLGVVALEYTLQPAAYVVILIGLSYAGVGVVLLADTVASYGPLYRNEVLAVAFSTVPPTVGLFVWMAGFGPTPAINWGVVLSLPHAGLDAYAFVGKNMFATSPTTRRVASEDAFDTIPDPVLVVDPTDRVVEHNAAAATVFDALGDGKTAVPVSTVLPEEVDVSGDDQYLTVRAGGGVREFSLRNSPLTDPRGAVVRQTLLLRDITNEREREQRLSVLNRVLRHNLRNKLDAVMGFSDQIADTTGDAETERFARRIVANAEELLDVSEKAREFDRLRRTEPAFEPVCLAWLLDGLVREFGARHGNATIEAAVDGADGPDDAAQGDDPGGDARAPLTVRTDPELLELALRNIIENALQHGGEAPRITVSADEPADGSGGVVIEIRDDGPGIPEHELAVLRDGEEDALEHGSGIGLWIVEWCLRVLGGSVIFKRDDGGTTVRLALPADPTE